jgi:hypothetical protein
MLGTVIHSVIDIFLLFQLAVQTLSTLLNLEVI